MNMSQVGREPLVSVCIPTYNRVGALQRAVRAIVEGAYRNVEIIISDNASTDETQAACLAMREKDSRIKYFRHAKNQGPTKNFAFAKSKASGKYFLWHGDDDYLDPNYIAVCVRELEADESLVLVSGLAVYHNEKNAITHRGNIIQLGSNVPIFRVVKYLWNVGDNSVFCGAYRLDQTAGCRMPNMLAGDWAWMAAVLKRGRSLVIPSVLVHRQYEKSTSSSYARIVQTIEAPSWHATWPRLVISQNVAIDFVLCSQEYRQQSRTRKWLDFFLVLLTLVVKGSCGYVREKLSAIPFLKGIYHRYVKKSAH
jgi:glycosyltransferase involved in cell wall biosynthesis